MKFNKLKNKNILITGIHGFVGSNLCKKLLEQKANIYGIYKNNNSNSMLIYENIQGYNTIQYSEDNYDKIDELILDKDIEYCYHLASQVEVKKAITNPKHTFNNNFNFTLKLLDSFKKSNKIKSIIITSTDKVYGDTELQNLPYRENLTPKPIYPYEVSKYVCELIGKCYYENFNLPIVITRTSNIFGPGQLNLSAIIPSIILAGLGKQEFIPRSNGQLKRDYLFIDDWVNSLIQLSILKSENKVSELIYNFGNNKPINALDLTKVIFEIINDNIKMKSILGSFKNIIDSKNEIIDQYICSDKAKDTLNIKYETNFKSAIEKTITWYQKYY